MKKMMSMVLLSAALLSVSSGVSAAGHGAQRCKDGKCKEIKFRKGKKCKCARCAKFAKFSKEARFKRFDARLDKRLEARSFDKRMKKCDMRYGKVKLRR